MAQSTRVAVQSDVPLLVEMMREFYAESGVPFRAELAEVAFQHLLSDSRLGRTWILLANERSAGYVVLTIGFSMQFGGLDAFVDDLFIAAPYRRQGLGRLALDTVREDCLQRGVRVLHLEVDDQNGAALSLYQDVGFRRHPFQLWSIVLTQDVHEA